jgi:hypothetical protein
LRLVEDGHCPISFDELFGGAEEDVIGGEHDAAALEPLE